MTGALFLMIAGTGLWLVAAVLTLREMSEDSAVWVAVGLFVPLGTLVYAVRNIREMRWLVVLHALGWGAAALGGLLWESGETVAG